MVWRQACVLCVLVAGLGAARSDAEPTAPPALREGAISAPAASASPELLAAGAPDHALAALLSGDYAGARAIAEAFAAAGDPASLHMLGYLLEKGLGTPADIGAAMAAYSEAAAAGSLDALVALGLLSLDGGAVMRDDARAAGWFRLAAERGDPRGQTHLGRLYADGRGVSRDPGKARALFAQAAGIGHPEAHFFLGLSMLEGEGGAFDPRAAAGHFIAAIEGGYAEAAFHLSLLLDSPLLGLPDPAGAVEAMLIASRAGYPPAMTAMGLYTHRGDAPGAAIDWFERAAAAGDLQGRLLFAIALAAGDGRTADPATARRLAADVRASADADDALRAGADALIASLDGPSLTHRLRD